MARTAKAPKRSRLCIRQGAPTHPVFHHFFVEKYAGHDDWDSIDGNSPHCDRHHHTALDPTITFYSVASLLPTKDELPEGGFVRGQKFSVPGIQD